jgi:lipoprotein signal peptidase
MLVQARVQHEMFLGQAIPIIPGLFNLRYLRNPGAAFSFLATTPEELRVPFFIAVTVLALAALTIMYIQEAHEGWLTRISLVSVAGGALSNLVERLLAGDVVDYLDVYVGPTTGRPLTWRTRRSAWGGPHPSARSYGGRGSRAKSPTAEGRPTTNR